jgi:hypothetical protein
LPLTTIEPGATEYIAVKNNIGMCHWTFDKSGLEEGTLDTTPIAANFDHGRFEHDRNELVLKLEASSGAVGSIKVMVTDSRETHKKELSKTIQVAEIPMELLASVTLKRPPYPDATVYYKISDLENGVNKPYLYVHDEESGTTPTGRLYSTDATVGGALTPYSGYDPGAPFDSTRTWYQKIELRRSIAYTGDLLETAYAEAKNTGHFSLGEYVSDTEETGVLIEHSSGGVYFARLSSFNIVPQGTYSDNWLAGGVSIVRTWVDYGEAIGAVLLPNTYTIAFSPSYPSNPLIPPIYLSASKATILYIGTGAEAPDVTVNGTIWQSAKIIDNDNYGASGAVYISGIKTQARCAGKRDGSAFNVAFTANIPYSTPDYDSVELIKGRPYEPYE